MVVFDSDQGADQLPLITVAMPVYNAGTYLRLAVLSIVKQTFTDWELLIIDDGSTDNALQGIADINDARIQILRDGINKGLAVRLNECIELARGKYFARMDADDVSYPERFEFQIDALKKDPQLDLVAVCAITIDESNKATSIFPGAIAHEEISSRPWRGFHFPHPTWMGKVEWFRKYRYANPAPYFCEDQELLLRSHRESRFATVDEILFAYRVRRKINWQKLAKTRWAVLKVQWRHFAKISQWHFASLAIMAYLLKMGSDVFKRLCSENNECKRVSVDDAVVSRWNRIRDGIAPDLKVP